jgi:hypothetical protein
MRRNIITVMTLPQLGENEENTVWSCQSSICSLAIDIRESPERKRRPQQQVSNIGGLT